MYSFLFIIIKCKSWESYGQDTTKYAQKLKRLTEMQKDKPPMWKNL